MQWIVLPVAFVLLGVSSICQAQTLYTNATCEYNVTFPEVALTKDDEFTARTEFEATPFLSAKCFRCPQACRFRATLEKRMLSDLLAQFELKDYVLAHEKDPHKGFHVSGITTKENAVTRIEARVLFSDNSILVLATVQPEAGDKKVATTFLQSAQRRNAP